MQYGRNKTKSMVAVKIVFVWVVSITISSPICIYGLIDESTVFNEQLCVITLKEFVIYGSIFAFYVPLCIMILTYMLTIRILWQNQQMMRTIERSNFRMRPRNINHSQDKLKFTALLSPPSSDSRRESHTDVSSLVRTPCVDKYNQSESSTNDLKTELRSLMNTRSATNEIVNLQKTLINNNNENDVEQKDISNAEDISKHSSPADSPECIDRSPALTVPMTTVNIQSPSTDDEDELSVLLSSSNEKLSRSLSHSSSGSRYRQRSNNKNYLSNHMSLKIPKQHEKSNNIQLSVSCSNFTESNPNKNELFESLKLQGNGLNRDYKSLEWCHHFYEIQEEMDQCLREARQERKQKSMEQVKQQLLNASLSDKDNLKENKTNKIGDNDTNGDKGRDSDTNTRLESGDSLDDIDSSSENASELLNIRLQPTSVYMYKLEVNNTSNGIDSNTHLKPNEYSSLNNGLQHKRASYDSEKSLELRKHTLRKPGSIKRFIYKCSKRKHGIKSLISSKTNSNEKKASKVLGIIFAVFVILWTPFFIANILSAACSSCVKYITPEMMSAFVWMGYIASLANPIIYTMFNTAFRRTFIKIISCHLCTKPGTTNTNRSSNPSQHATLINDRRQTVTVLYNGIQERYPSDLPSNKSTGR